MGEKSINSCTFSEKTPHIRNNPIMLVKIQQKTEEVAFLCFAILSTSLIVGNTFCLGRPGLLGGEGQNHQGYDIGQHIVHHTGDIHRCQEIKTGVYIAQSTAEAEQQGSQSDLQGMPGSEDHNSQSKEAKAGHTVFKLPDADTGGDIYDAA